MGTDDNGRNTGAERVGEQPNHTCRLDRWSRFRQEAEYRRTPPGRCAGQCNHLQNCQERDSTVEHTALGPVRLVVPVESPLCGGQGRDPKDVLSSGTTTMILAALGAVAWLVMVVSGVRLLMR